ncbi:uncharacterized protein LOC113517883 [Galleria mellonella]|uniref:Uncharacterized protein LOC113517883 n=1 Tax=Galleria mellonella TaxID=7137 RepID=A0A6J1WSK3_GALME|nr:uncharacterized protein LOC113517883 [Galleria mellonella]
MRKGGDNSQTPVRSTPDNITVRKKSQIPPGNNLSPSEHTSTASEPEALLSLSSEISLLRQTMNEMWNCFRERLDTLGEKLSNYDERLRVLETQACENAALKASISALKEQLNNQTQLSLRKELEIAGLAESLNENPVHLALTTALKLGINLQETDLDYVSRAGPKRQGKEKNNDHSPSMPRPLVVAFVRRAKRDEFLEHSRNRRPLKSKDIITNDSDSTIYVNERLTNDNRRLFRDSRLFAKKHGYKHCWVRNGFIFLRKEDYRDGSPAIRIQFQDDLERLVTSISRHFPKTDTARDSSVIASSPA